MVSVKTVHIDEVLHDESNTREYTALGGTKISLVKESALMHKVFFDDIQALAVIDTRECTDEMVEKAKQEDPLFGKHVRIIGSFGNHDVDQEIFDSITFLVAYLVRKF